VYNRCSRVHLLTTWPFNFVNTLLLNLPRLLVLPVDFFFIFFASVAFADFREVSSLFRLVNRRFRVVAIIGTELPAPLVYYKYIVLC